MTLFLYQVLYRKLLSSSLGKPYLFTGLNCTFKKFSTNFQVKRFNRVPLKYVFTGVPVTALGAGYYYYYKVTKNDANESANMYENLYIPYAILDSKPDVPVARKRPGVLGGFNLHLVLFQYPTCPFCCKVRAFLDYYGLPYDIVEVDPVLRQQTKWTTYKKVPILLVKIDEGYQQLNDSTMIISAMKSFLMKYNENLKEVVSCYPMVESKDAKGKATTEILNKYFVLYNDNLPKDKTNEIIMEEKKWREWADNSLVHTLSPNVYRTFDESMQAFKWFSEVGEWDRLFPAWEKNIIIYVGSFAMWIIGKRLKKRHKLLDDERESLYQECKKWMKALSEKKTIFMGGTSPNLADLAVYGVLSSIEGCLTFNDVLKHTTIGNWYYPVKEAVNSHAGKSELAV